MSGDLVPYTGESPLVAYYKKARTPVLSGAAAALTTQSYQLFGSSILGLDPTLVAFLTVTGGVAVLNTIAARAFNNPQP
jgi:hypothetical protein